MLEKHLNERKKEKEGRKLSKMLCIIDNISIFKEFVLVLVNLF